jgi:hypothetical protein
MTGMGSQIHASWRIAIAVAAVAAVQPHAALAQSFDREVAFLLIPTGARPVGMGRAATAAAGTVQSVAWNPATVSGIGGFAPLVSSYDGPLEFGVTRLAIALPVAGLGVFSISVEAQSFGDIPLTGAGSAESTNGVVSPNNLIVGVTYGRPLVRRLAFGVTAKFIHSELFAGLEGSTTALDAGLLWSPFQNVPLNVGLSALNLGRGLKLDRRPDAERDPLPSRVRLGVGYDVLGHLRPDLGWQLLIAFDEEHAVRSLETASQYLGVELGVQRVLFIRGGWIAETLIETNSGSTLGVGLRLGALDFDIARELGVNELGDETHVSIGARF